MAKVLRSYRISEECDTLIKCEAERLTALAGDAAKRISEADIVESAVMAALDEKPEASGPPKKETLRDRILRERDERVARAEARARVHDKSFDFSDDFVQE